MKRTLQIALMAGLILLGIRPAVFAQSFVRLNTTTIEDTISSNGDSIVLSSQQVGGFGSIKVQTKDSYSGTWEVQCAVDEDGTYDADNELGLKVVDGSTTAYSVTDDVGIWDVVNAAGCRSIRVIATAGFAASDTVVVIRATQTGGGGGGGGGAGTSDTTEATQLNVLTEVEGINTSASDLAATIAMSGTDLNVICTSGCGGSGGTAAADDADFTAGMTEGTPAQGVYESTPTNVTDGDLGTVGITQKRAQRVALESAAGTAAFGTAGTAATPVLTVQGIASMTALTVSASNLDVQIGGSDTVQVQSNAANLATQATLATIDADTSALVATINVSGTDLNVICTSGCAGGVQYAEDAVHASGNTGTLGLAVRNDAGTALAADGDNIPLMVNSAGALFVAPTGTQVVSATNLDVQIGGSDTVTVTATNLDVQSGGADLATEATLASILADTAAIDTATAAAASSLSNIESALSADAVHDNAVIATGPGIQLEAKDIDGSALPNVVTEGDSVRAAATLSGATLMTIVNEAGTADVGANLNAGVQFEDFADVNNTGLYVAGAVRRDAAASSSGTTGDFSTVNTDALGLLWTRQLDPCSGVAKNYYVVNMSTATTNEIANAVANEFWYICSVNLVAAAAQTVAIGHDDTDGCGSITAGMHGGATAATGWSFAANGGISLGNGGSTVMKSATANHYLCIITGQAAQISGTISYVSAP